MKTKLTRKLEVDFLDYLYDVKYELGILECSLGGGRYGIVDVLSYHGKLVKNGRGKPRTREVTWRCYEIKTSKADFYSKHKLTFEGDYNYFVMPEELFEVVQDDIPKGIGCYLYNPSTRAFRVAKKASRHKTRMSESQIMHDYLVSNNRDSRRWAHYKMNSAK